MFSQKSMAVRTATCAGRRLQRPGPAGRPHTVRFSHAASDARVEAAGGEAKREAHRGRRAPPEERGDAHELQPDARRRVRDEERGRRRGGRGGRGAGPERVARFLRAGEDLAERVGGWHAARRGSPKTGAPVRVREREDARRRAVRRRQRARPAGPEAEDVAVPAQRGVEAELDDRVPSAPVETELPSSPPRRRRDSSRRNIYVTVAASACLHGISTSQPRRRRDSSPPNIQKAAAFAETVPRLCGIFRGDCDVKYRLKKP